jgi:hypothetical protein
LHPIPNQGARHCGDLFSVAFNHRERLLSPDIAARVEAAIAKASAEAEAKLAEELAKAEVAGKRRIEVEVKKALEAAHKDVVALPVISTPPTSSSFFTSSESVT